MTTEFEVVKAVNECNIAQMADASRTLDPKQEGARQKFGEHVLQVQSSIMHTYRMVAHAALREANPANAAELWKGMGELCNQALEVLKASKEKFPYCGAPELYDLALDYKLAADEKHKQNLQDSECLNQPIPAGLFPKTT